MKASKILLISVLSSGLLFSCSNEEKSDSDITFIVGTTMQVAKTSPSDDCFSKLSATCSSLPLIYQDKDGYHGLLFDYEIVKTSKGFSDYYFTPKDGATWSDGVSLTNEDLIFSLDYYKEYDSTFTLYKSLETYEIEDGKAHLSFKADNANISSISNFTTLRILPKHIYEGKDYQTYLGEDATTGNGPYKFESFNEDNNTLTFASRNDYFMGVPKVKNLIFKIYDDSDSLNLALKSKEIDTIYNYGASLSAAVADDLTSNEDVQVEKLATSNIPYILIYNLGNEKMSDLKYRKAISLAIDYQSIVNTLGSSSSTPGKQGLINEGIVGFCNTDNNYQDVEAAKNLMNELGYIKKDDGYYYRDGNKATFNIATRLDKVTFVRASELIKNSLDSFGIETSITTYNNAADFQKATGHKDTTHEAVVTSLTSGGINMEYGLASKYFDGELDNNVQAGNILDETYLNLFKDLNNCQDEITYLEKAKEIQEYYASNYVASALLCDYSLQAHLKTFTNFTLDFNYGLLNALTWYSIDRV